MPQIPRFSNGFSRGLRSCGLDVPLTSALDGREAAGRKSFLNSCFFELKKRELSCSNSKPIYRNVLIYWYDSICFYYFYLLTDLFVCSPTMAPRIWNPFQVEMLWELPEDVIQERRWGTPSHHFGLRTSGEKWLKKPMKRITTWFGKASILNFRPFSFFLSPC